MKEPRIQFITNGEEPEYAVLPIEYYLEITSKLEDIEDIQATDQAFIDDLEGKTVPGEVVNSILDGMSPLRAWRQSRGLTLDSLAKRVGVSKSYLSQIENNRKSGSLKLFRQISAVLDVAVDDLICWGEGTTRPGVDAV